ncbi:hypothetical protein EDC96DRAFT_141898 [Choanephora cucurbitarum]|nr:hypothetical protein EDC96DRAFT_141898 [Choanephora cucurbitarum]
MALRNNDCSSIRSSCGRIEDKVINLEGKVQDLLSAVNSITDKLDRCVSVLTSFGAGEASSSLSAPHVEEETVSSGLLIFRPTFSTSHSNLKNTIDMKIKHFVTQWLGDQVVVQENDLSFVREEKESKIEMYKTMLYQLSRILITKMIFEIEKNEKIGKQYHIPKFIPISKKRL